MVTILGFIFIAVAVGFGALIHFYGNAVAVWILYGAFFGTLALRAWRDSDISNRKGTAHGTETKENMLGL